MSDATRTPYNFTTIFTPQQIYGLSYPNAVYGIGIPTTPINGMASNSLLEGPYAITFVGSPVTLYRYVPGLWVTNIAGMTLPINLEDARWSLKAFQTTLVVSNYLTVTNTVTLSAVTNFYFSTNFFNTTNTAYTTNYFTVTNTIALLAITNAFATNSGGVTIIGQVAWVNTNYDVLGAASSAFQSGSNLSYTLALNNSNSTTAAFQTGSNLAYSLLGNSSSSNNVIASFQSASNLSYALALNNSNATTSAFQSGSNLSYTLGANGSNNASGVFQSGSNLSYSLALNNSNATTAAFQSGSNLSYTLGANGSNNVSGTAAATFQGSSNLSYTLGLNGSNNATGTFQSASNLSYALALNNSNATTVAFQSGSNLSYTLGQNGSNATTAAFQSGSNLSYSLAQAASNLVASSSVTFANVATNALIGTNAIATLNTNYLVLQGAGTAGANTAGADNAGYYLRVSAVLLTNANNGIWFTNNGSIWLQNNAAGTTLATWAVIGNGSAGVIAAGTAPAGITVWGVNHNTAVNGEIFPALNGTAIFQSGSNLSYALAQTGSNATTAAWQSNSNLSYSLAQNNSNATTAAFQSGSNLSYTLGANGSNNAAGVFQSVSNLSFNLNTIALANITSVAATTFQAGSNLSYSLGHNDSNNDLVTFQSSSNLSGALAAGLTNYVNTNQITLPQLPLAAFTNGNSLIAYFSNRLYVAGYNYPDSIFAAVPLFGTVNLGDWGLDKNSTYVQINDVGMTIKFSATNGTSFAGPVTGSFFAIGGNVLTNAAAFDAAGSASSAFQSGSNLSYTLALNNSNATTAAFQSGSNLSYTLAQNVSNSFNAANAETNILIGTNAVALITTNYLVLMGAGTAGANTGPPDNMSYYVRVSAVLFTNALNGDWFTNNGSLWLLNNAAGATLADWVTIGNGSTGTIVAGTAPTGITVWAALRNNNVNGEILTGTFTGALFGTVQAGIKTTNSLMVFSNGSAANVYEYSQNPNAPSKILWGRYTEDNTIWNNDFFEQFATVYNLTGYNANFDFAHNYAAGVTVYRMNGGTDYNIYGDTQMGMLTARALADVGVLYGTNGYNGVEREFLLLSAVDSPHNDGRFARPMKIDSYSRVQVGFSPLTNHTVFTPANAVFQIHVANSNEPQMTLDDSGVFNTNTLVPVVQAYGPNGLYTFPFGTNGPLVPGIQYDWVSNGVNDIGHNLPSATAFTANPTFVLGGSALVVTGTPNTLITALVRPSAMGFRNVGGQYALAQKGNAGFILTGPAGYRDAGTLTNLSASQLVGQLPPSNSSTTLFTNIISGLVQTNFTSLSMTWRVPVVVSSPAGVIGNAEVDALLQPAAGGGYVAIDDVRIAGGITSIVATNGDNLIFEVPPGWGFVVTNNVSGAGYVAALDASKTNQLTLHP